jgi:hypothetical protein
VLYIRCNGRDEDGNVKSECEEDEMKTLTVKMETVTLTGKGRQDVTCFVYSAYEINSKLLFLSRCFIFGGHLRFE